MIQHLGEPNTFYVKKSISGKEMETDTSLGIVVR